MNRDSSFDRPAVSDAGDSSSLPSLSPEEFCSIIQDTIAEMVFIATVEGRCTYLSPKFETATGHLNREVVGRTMSELFDEADARCVAVNARSIAADANLVPRFAVDIITKEGGRMPVEIIMRSLCRGTDRPAGIFGIIRDLRPLRKTGESIQENHAKYWSILESMSDGYYEVNLAGTYTLVNESFGRMLLYDPSEIVGLSYRNIVDVETAEKLKKGFHELYVNGGPGKIIMGTMKRRDGILRFAEGSVNLMLDSLGRKSGFFGIIRDVTERRVMEEILAMSERELRNHYEGVERDLTTARAIQRELIPSSVPELDSLAAEYRYLPLDGLGGDYFSFSMLPGGGLGVFVGDVSNHGVSAALFLSLIKASTERIFRKHAASPGLFMKELNEEMNGNMPKSFLTALYGCITPYSGGVTFTFSAGGHPRPIVYRKNSGTAEVIPCRGTLLGVLEDLVFEEKTVRLETGDRIFLYTDGIAEIMNEHHQYIWFEGLLEMISKGQKPTLGETLDSLMNSVHAFRGREPIADDIILIGFEVVPAPSGGPTEKNY